ncbi:MAG: molybdate ABC transporter substrate-binding protein [Actinomycetia bacterium]|nr:molybdate ABC transporter substrate-binding protein [Actinomycetes bacterium]
MKRFATVMAGAVLVATPACSGTTADDKSAVLVFAASSMTDAFAEIEVAFENAHPGTDVQINIAGSSSLREQILGGAPADVFVSADESNMGTLVIEGEVAGQPRPLVVNGLQLAVPAGNPAGVSSLGDLASSDLLVGLCAEQVPCGFLARGVLARAGVEPSPDTNEPDVRALLTKIGAGELDVGMVYRTDVISAGDLVEGIDIPDEYNLSTIYPIAQLEGAPNPAGAALFIEFVLSEAGRVILDGHGFGLP